MNNKFWGCKMINNAEGDLTLVDYSSPSEPAYGFGREWAAKEIELEEARTGKKVINCEAVTEIEKFTFYGVLYTEERLIKISFTYEDDGDKC